VFVFGSNLAGHHGKGAALTALKKYHAVYGVGYGRQGMSFAIPTKDSKLRPLPLKLIKIFVRGFLAYATTARGLYFKVTPIGCGLAGYTPEEIAPFFRDAPPNCLLPESFKEVLEE
jgi:hypothetical protein